MGSGVVRNHPSDEFGRGERIRRHSFQTSSKRKELHLSQTSCTAPTAGVSLGFVLERRDVNRIRIAIVCLAAFVGAWGCARAGETATSPTAPAASSLPYSDASINGTYTMTAMLKPYVKFGGPQIASGELHYDGLGAVS